MRSNVSFKGGILVIGIGASNVNSYDLKLTKNLNNSLQRRKGKAKMIK
jgi:hypothetical protein